MTSTIPSDGYGNIIGKPRMDLSPNQHILYTQIPGSKPRSFLSGSYACLLPGIEIRAVNAGQRKVPSAGCIALPEQAQDVVEIHKDQAGTATAACRSSGHIP
jgi:hypothetical protein